MKYLKIILIPILFALLLRVIFGASIFDDYLSVMTWTFFILVPLAIGALTVYYSSIEKAESIIYRIFAPWLPIVLVIFLTILIGLEGWACWIMISPLFLIFGSIGGAIAGYFKVKKSKKTRKFKPISTGLTSVYNWTNRKQYSKKSRSF